MDHQHLEHQAAAAYCLRERFGLGRAPRLRLELEVAPHPVWRRGSVLVWSAVRPDGAATYAVTHERGISVLTGAPTMRLLPGEAWAAHVGEALLEVAAPAVHTEVPRRERMALERRLGTSGLDAVYWERFCQFGTALAGVGRLGRGRRLRTFVVGLGRTVVEERPLGTLLLLQMTLGRWWLGPATARA